MTHREFFFDGQRWEVWEVRPGVRGEPRTVSPQLTQGWLAFGSATEKRRLAPIPGGWAEFSDEALGDLCKKATFVRERGESGIWPRFRG